MLELHTSGGKIILKVNCVILKVLHSGQNLLIMVSCTLNTAIIYVLSDLN